MNSLDTVMNGAVKNMITAVVESTAKTGARFASFTYTNQNGETSRHNTMLGINIVSLYKADLRTLTALRPTLTGIKAVACDELIASVNNSLTKGIGNNDNYTLKGYYTPLTPSGEVKLHVDDKTNETFLYIRGYVIKKSVLVKGTYPVVKSSDKTLAKNEIEKTLKRGKIRTFKINVNQLHEVKMNGLALEIS
jgi:hypothetical protein